ncbi:MAG TPA: hypothetical protein VN653_00720 [Anaerolineales bacterium]|nr:hypothetical protein [Anaerolineales bacterium]
MDYNSQRRRTGLVLGLILGTAYSLTSNLINRLALPGIPLYTPPPGEFGLIVITALMFGALGLLAAWPDEALPGVLISGLAGSFISSIWIFGTETNKTATLALLVLLFLPRMFFYLPLGVLVRWLISRMDQPAVQNIAPVRRLMPVILAFALMVFLGTLTRYPKETRTALVRMNELMKAGLPINTRADLPKPLLGVEGFVQNADGAYSFLIGSDPDVLPVQRPVVEYGEPEPFIIIRFENGFRFGCVFSPPYVNPACSDF